MRGFWVKTLKLTDMLLPHEKLIKQLEETHKTKLDNNDLNALIVGLQKEIDKLEITVGTIRKSFSTCFDNNHGSAFGS